MRNTLLTIAILTAFTGGTLSANGWSHKQGQDTVKGGVFGAVIGGVVGHQSGNQKEGILIGTVLGGIVGNKIGKGRDARHEHARRQEEIRQAQERQQVEYERKRNEHVRSSGRVVYDNSNSPIHGQVNQEDKVLMDARIRAEKAERELNAELEKQRQTEERRRALAEYREREKQARERLLRAKGYTPENYPTLFQ